MGAACCNSSHAKDDAVELMEGEGLHDSFHPPSVFTRSADDALLEELLQVEGDRNAQDRLAQTKQVTGCAMIVSLAIVAPGADHMELLFVQRHLQALLEAQVWPKSKKESILLVKVDGPRFFVHAMDASQALQAALKVQHLVKAFPEWFVAQQSLKKIQLTVESRIGIADGTVILLPGDMYGDPVNTSSKLGEDLAKPGDIFVSSTAFSAACEDPVIKDLLPSLVTATEEVKISKVTLSYTSVQAIDLSQLVRAIGTIEDLQASQALVDVTSYSDAPYEKMAVMVTDLSGFTSLTKTHGILHFLRLVLKARSIFIPRIESNGGRVVKYEGDNIIAVFPSATDALACIKDAKIELDHFNSAREKDFQIRMGIALDQGEVLVIGHDIFGEAFDHSFHMAEEVSEAGEVLVAASLYDNLRELGLLAGTSACRQVEHPLNKTLIDHHSVDFSRV